MNGDRNLLGEFLRARREHVTPQEVGIPVVGLRRVPGLRREEVALRAGISPEYYLRLEQGRDRAPSRQVLLALARALRLDEAETTHLVSLASPGDDHRAPARAGRVPASILDLLESLALPAFVEGRSLDVLAANSLATALSPRLVVGANRLRDLLLDADEQSMFPDWEAAAEVLVAGFRQSVGTDVNDPSVRRLVDELSSASSTFRRLWARHEVHPLQSGRTTVIHPTVGELTLSMDKLVVPGTDVMRLVVLHAAPGSDDEAKLARLAPVLDQPGRRTGRDARSLQA